MLRKPLDIYDEMPTGMRRYISNYGWHFNKKAYEYAASLMKNKDGKLSPYTKEDVKSLLKLHSVEVENDTMYDAVFVAMMGRADYLGSSIPDEKHLALYVKDTLDDVDAADDTTFRRWVATMIGNGVGIDWDELT